MNWSIVPDLLAVALLSSAFAAVARRSLTPASGIWLTGWVMIAVDFAALIATPAIGAWGIAASFIALAALASAGILFTWASVPYRSEPSSTWILAGLLATNTLYIGLLSVGPNSMWALVPAALLLGAVPLFITLLALPRFNHPLRWMLVSFYVALSIFLLTFQNRPGNGPDLALDAIFFTVYFTCSVHFWYAYCRLTAGAFITISGFLAWTSVFVITPAISAYYPDLHVETEVWNLPKYVVALGMIMLQLEDQIEHNLHLALHDELTGLPNRRLFVDRLNSTIERARRGGSQAALLIIDLDEFKQVNDLLGHHVGDLLLKRVSKVLAERVRRSDTVARTGGDEFSIILGEPASRDDADCIAESLIQLLEKPFELDGHIVHVGASVGIAIFPTDAPAAESLQVAADLRMYAAKYASKGINTDTSTRYPSAIPLTNIQ